MGLYRVKDVDFGYARTTVRDGKGAKDRVTMLPLNLASAVGRHLQKVKVQYEEDREAGVGGVYLAGGAGAEISQRSAGVGLAVGVPVHTSIS